MHPFIQAAFVVALLQGLVAQGDDSCENGWISGFQGSCYLFVTNPKADWDTAKARCEEMNSYLTALETKNEIIWMRGYRSYHASLREKFYIGGLKKEDKWYWTESNDQGDYVLIDILDWAYRQPDNVGRNQKCLALLGETAYYASPSGEWYKFDDETCSVKHGYICEKDINDNLKFNATLG